MKTALLFAAGVVVLLGVVAAWVVGPYALSVERIEADPSGGYYADFYLYMSPDARAAAARGDSVVLLVQPNNSGTNSDDPEVHRKDAWWTGFGRRGLADRLGVALLVPAFVRPSVDWHIYTHALDRDALTTERTDLGRPDLQLIAMVDRAREHAGASGVAVRERFLLQGYSASGMFANRFAVLHPDRVLAVAAGSPGGWPIAPLSEWQGEALLYPAGVADLEALVGTPFDSASYGSVPQLIVMGTLDENDSVDFRDGWDEVPAAQVDRLFGADPMSRWEVARRLYAEAGADAEFLLIDDVGHDRRALQSYSTAFFERILSDDQH